MVDRTHAEGSASPRWAVLSVRPPGGIFHPKIALLVWHGWIRLMIGSANLTEPGYRKNQEVFGVLDFHHDGQVQRAVLTECLDFLDSILPFSPGSEAEAGPKSRLKTFLQDVRAAASRWKTNPLGTSESARVEPVFLGPMTGYNGSILKRLGQLIRDRGGPAHEANVLSPFFDLTNDQSYRPSEELLSALTDRGSRKIHYMVPFEELVDGHIRLRAPKTLIGKGKKSAEVSIWPVGETVDGEFRPLHSKSIWLWNDSWEVYMVGSSNFTSAGMGLAKNASNFEANLAYVFRQSLEGPMEKTLPAWDEALKDLTKVSWQAIDENVGEGAVGGSILPSDFDEALFEPGETESFINLRFGKNLPADWTICFKDHTISVLSAVDWRSLGSLTAVRLKWTEKAIPNELEVDWIDTAQQKQSAHWPVNVTDPGKLPPPDALRDLSLQTLLEILCSGRPLHEALVSRSANGGESSGGGEIPLELDPLRRFNSETFLLQRTRRVAKAIDQLVANLSRPVVHRDALDWRLRGPVGPCALAKAICKEASTPSEACFLLSEIILVLRRIDASKIAVGVDKETIVSAMNEVVVQISSMIAEQRASNEIPESIAVYISAALAQS